MRERIALFAVISLLFSLAACAPATPTPTAAPRQPRYTNVLPNQPSAAETAPGPACLAMFGYGLTCLDETGWHTFDGTNSPLSGNVRQVVACPADYFLVVHTFGAALFDGKDKWKDLAYDLPAGYDRAGCDGENNIWLTHWKGLSRFDGENWSEIPLAEITQGAEAESINDIAVAPDGTAWVALTHTVARFAKGIWTLYSPALESPEDYYFYQIALDDLDRPWAMFTRGLFHFDPRGDQWKEYSLQAYFSPTALAFDPQGLIWVAGFNDLYTFDPDGMFTDYASALAAQPIGPMLRDVAVDDRGRVWVGTSWGVLVFGAGEGERVYHMHTADLAGNDVFDLAVLRGGPALPALIELPTGSLSGKLVFDGATLAEVQIQVCTEMLLTPDLGAESPCSEYPSFYEAVTDAEGIFELPSLLAGRYRLLAQAGQQTGSDKPWIEVLDSVHALPGESLYLGELTIK